MGTALIGQLFRDAFTTPLSADGKTMPLCTRLFWLTHSTTQATVYQDAALTTPYVQPVVADANGRFSPIYLSPGTEYRTQLFNAAGQLLEDTDTVNNNAAGPPNVAGVAVAAFKAASTTRSVTTFLGDPDLIVAIPGPGTYKLDCDIVCTAAVNGTTALQIGFGNISTGATGSALAQSGTLGASTFLSSTGGTIIQNPPFNGTPGSNNVTTLPKDNTMHFSGTFVAPKGTPPGATIQVWWAPVAAASLTMLAGSSLVVTQIG